MRSEFYIERDRGEGEGAVEVRRGCRRAQGLSLHVVALERVMGVESVVLGGWVRCSGGWVRVLPVETLGGSHLLVLGASVSRCALHRVESAAQPGSARPVWSAV